MDARLAHEARVDAVRELQNDRVEELFAPVAELFHLCDQLDAFRLDVLVLHGVWYFAHGHVHLGIVINELVIEGAEAED